MKCLQLLLAAWLITSLSSVVNGEEWEFRDVESQDGNTSVSLGWLNECVPVGVEYVIRLRLLVTSRSEVPVSTFSLAFYYDWGDGNFHSQVIPALPVGVTYEFEQKHVYDRVDTYRQDVGGEVSVQELLTVPLSQLWHAQVGQNSCSFPTSIPTSPPVAFLVETMVFATPPDVSTPSSFPVVLPPPSSPVFAATDTPTSDPSFSFSPADVPVVQPSSPVFSSRIAPTSLPTSASRAETTAEEPTILTTTGQPSALLITSSAAIPFTTTTILIIIIAFYFTSATTIVRLS